MPRRRSRQERPGPPNDGPQLAALAKIHDGLAEVDRAERINRRLRRELEKAEAAVAAKKAELTRRLAQIENA